MAHAASIKSIFNKSGIGLALDLEAEGEGGGVGGEEVLGLVVAEVDQGVEPQTGILGDRLLEVEVQALLGADGRLDAGVLVEAVGQGQLIELDVGFEVVADAGADTGVRIVDVGDAGLHVAGALTLLVLCLVAEPQARENVVDVVEDVEAGAEDAVKGEDFGVEEGVEGQVLVEVVGEVPLHEDLVVVVLVDGGES